MPHIDVVGVLDVEHEVRVARQRLCAQAWQGECMGVARRACGRVATDVLRVKRLTGAEQARFACRGVHQRSGK